MRYKPQDKIKLIVSKIKDRLDEINVELAKMEVVGLDKVKVKKKKTKKVIK